MATANKKIKTVIGQIADSSGHTDFVGTVDEAVDTIVEQVKAAGKWVYVNGNPFIFGDPDDAAEINKLRNAFDVEDEPNFVLTGKLQGGASKRSVFRSRVINGPVSRMLNTKNRPQLVVYAKQNGGVEYVDVLTTEYRNATTRLSKYGSEIVKSIAETLGVDVQITKPRTKRAAKSSAKRAAK